MERTQKVSPRHVRTLLWILRGKNNYFSLEELEKNTLVGNGELKRIMQSLTENELLQKDGCLYRKPEREKIAEII